MALVRGSAELRCGILCVLRLGLSRLGSVLGFALLSPTYREGVFYAMTVAAVSG